MARHFLQGEIPNTPPHEARIHVIPAPLEVSVSYGPGAAAGPEAILAASEQLELFDGRSVPAEAGIHTTEPVPCGRDAAKALEAIETAVARCADFNALPVVLGGEHTVTLGALRALKQAHGHFGIIQFDAHADLRDSYEGSKLSHACVMRRAVDDLGLDLFQIGVRALSLEEASYRETHSIPHLDARALYLKGIPRPLLPKDFPTRVYISLDVDGLDPSVIRATGTPVPGGIGWHDALTLLELAAAGRTVLGADLVELAPAPGDHASDFAAAQLAYHLMGLCLARD